MFFAKTRLTQHEQRCAKEFAGESPRPAWDHLYAVLPFDLMEMAERGEPKAAFVMGDRFDQGMCGLDSDLVKALVYYRIGEEQGDPDALNNIGSMHFHGDGLPRDMVAARIYFERAAEGGCPAAMNNLGRMLLEGEGGLQTDIKRGMAILEQGARLYDVNAALKMQAIYRDGQYGQSADLKQRIYWLWQAIYNGSGSACATIADFLREGEVVSQQLPRMRELYEKGAELGDSYATLQIGIVYKNGVGGRKDIDTARHYLLQAEDMGEEFATEMLAKLP